MREPLVVPGNVRSLGYLFRWDTSDSLARGMDVVSLAALCSWAGFSYSSYSYAVAIAMGLSFSWMRRNALRLEAANSWVETSSDRSLVLRRCWTSADDYRRCRQYNNGIRPLSSAQ